MKASLPSLQNFTTSAFAHRGLHGSGVPENSLAAFERAVAAGNGIECDLRMSADGVVYVFHDRTLGRMTGVAGEIGKTRALQLDRLTLLDTLEAPPRLTAVLETIKGTRPILLELKADSILEACRLSWAVARELGTARGAVAVMSFHIFVPLWFRLFAPKVPRGIVIAEHNRRVLIHRFAIWLTKSHFFALDIRRLPSRLSLWARGKGLPIFTWTVRSVEETERARLHADAPIFEKAEPA